MDHIKVPSGRIKSEYATIQAVTLRVCAVSFADVRGIRHTVEVQAESLFEAAILGVRTFKGDPWIEHATARSKDIGGDISRRQAVR